MSICLSIYKLFANVQIIENNATSDVRYHSAFNFQVSVCFTDDLQSNIFGALKCPITQQVITKYSDKTSSSSNRFYLQDRNLSRTRRDYDIAIFIDFVAVAVFLLNRFALSQHLFTEALDLSVVECQQVVVTSGFVARPILDRSLVLAE